jgi:hypothetical protein
MSQPQYRNETGDERGEHSDGSILSESDSDRGGRRKLGAAFAAVKLSDPGLRAAAGAKAGLTAVVIDGIRLRFQASALVAEIRIAWYLASAFRAYVSHSVPPANLIEYNPSWKPTFILSPYSSEI